MKQAVAQVLVVAAAIAAIGSGYYFGMFWGVLRQEHQPATLAHLRLFSLFFAPFSLIRFLLTVGAASMTVLCSSVATALAPEIQQSAAVPILTAVFQGSITAAALLGAAMLYRAQSLDFLVQEHERRVNDVVRSALAMPDFVLPRRHPGALLASLHAVANLCGAGQPSEQAVSALVDSISRTTAETFWSKNSREILETTFALLRGLRADQVQRLHEASSRIKEEALALAASQAERDSLRLIFQRPLVLISCCSLFALLASVLAASANTILFFGTGLIYFVVGVAIWGVIELLWSLYRALQRPAYLSVPLLQVLQAVDRAVKHPERNSE